MRITRFQRWTDCLFLARGEALRSASRLPLAFIFRAVGAPFPLFVQSRAHDIAFSEWPGRDNTAIEKENLATSAEAKQGTQNQLQLFIKGGVWLRFFLRYARYC